MAIPDPVVERLEQIERRHRDIEQEIQQAATRGDSARLASCQIEYGRIAPIVALYQDWGRIRGMHREAREVEADDPDLSALAAEEARGLEEEMERAEARILEALGSDPGTDDKNVFLEVRAAVGGDEAGIFAGDLLRMYERYAERRRWKFDIVHASPGSQGGFREAIASVTGKGAYGDLRFESGGHRVQRVPETESQGRIHTSVCTVAVLPEAKPQDVTVSPDDIRMETFRASGAGGQHVNKTDSAVRVTHLPTMTVVECQSNRSQHRNRETALAVLRSRLQDRSAREAKEKEADLRRSLVGSGDRSGKIRTYNFAQDRVTDHRIKLTRHGIQEILDGDLGSIVAEMKRHQAVQDALAGAEAVARA